MRCSRFFQSEVCHCKRFWTTESKLRRFHLETFMVTGFFLITGFCCIAVDHLIFVHGFESDRMFVNGESFSGMQECLSNTFSSFQRDPIQFKNKIRKAGDTMSCWRWIFGLQACDVPAGVTLKTEHFNMRTMKIPLHIGPEENRPPTGIESYCSPGLGN